MVLSRQKGEKTFSSIAVNFRGWTIVPSEKGNKWNLILARDVMVVPWQSR
jgi:hypothetical protein